MLPLGCAMSFWRVTDVRVKALAVFNVQHQGQELYRVNIQDRGSALAMQTAEPAVKGMLTSAIGVHTSDGVMHCANDPLEGYWYQCCQEQHAGCDLSKASSPEHEFECTQKGSQCCGARLQRF